MQFSVFVTLIKRTVSIPRTRGRAAETSLLTNSIWSVYFYDTVKTSHDRLMLDISFGAARSIFRIVNTTHNMSHGIHART